MLSPTTTGQARRNERAGRFSRGGGWRGERGRGRGRAAAQRCRAERPDLHPDIHDASMPPIGLKPQDCLHSTMAPGAFDGEVSQLLVRARSEVSLATCIPGAGKTRSRACKKVRMGTYGEVASGRRHVLKVDPRRKFVWARSPSISLLVHLREPDPASP